MTRTFTAILAAAGIAAAAGAASAADKPADFPNKPIEVVVVYPAGGGMDTTARTFAKAAEDKLGHRFNVVNRVGGGGLVGHTYLAKEAPEDGYTVGVLAMGNLITDMKVKGGEFAAEDFDPITFLNFDPVVLMTKDKSLEELLEKAKAEPGSVRVGVTPKSATSLIVKVMEDQLGLKFTRVPFQGGKPRVAALLNGTIDINPSYYVEGEDYIKDGTFKVVMVANTKPVNQAPDAPLASKFGIEVPTDTFGAARFVALPSGVPADRRAYLADAFLEVMKDPEAKAAFDKLGLVIDPQGPEATKATFDNTVEAISKNLD